MKSYWAVPVLASILILGTLVLTQDVFAPAPEKPEKLTITGVSWNEGTESFEVAGTIQFGLAETIENGQNTIKFGIRLTNASGDSVELDPTCLTPHCGRTAIPVPEVNIDYLVIMKWDRIVDGEIFQGSADFTVNAEILNPSGNSVISAEPFTDNLNITPPPAEICDDGIDNDNDGDVDCDDLECRILPECFSDNP